MAQTITPMDRPSPDKLYLTEQSRSRRLDLSPDPLRVQGSNRSRLDCDSHPSSMPRLTGGAIRQAAADEVSSRQSNHSMLFNQSKRRYNHSTDLLTPIKSDTMRMTGTNVLGP